MNKICLIILSISTVFATSCNKDDISFKNNQNNCSIKISANTPQKNPDTKVSFNDDENAKILYVDWKSSGEKFSVIRGSSNEAFSQTESTEDNINIFEGTLPDQQGDGEYYAIYPHNENVDDVEAVPYDLSEQTGLPDEAITYMYASAETITDGTELDFRQMTAILKPDFNLQNGEKVQTIIITLPENTYSKGTFNVKDQTFAPDNGNNRVIHTFVNDADDVYIYLPAIEVTDRKEIALEVHTTNSMYTGTIELVKPIKAGTLYVTELNLTETSNYVWTNNTNSVAPTSGDGTEGSPYQIVTAENLQWLLKSVNDNEDDNNNPTKGKHYKLMHNLVIRSSVSEPWRPIGMDKYQRHKFLGTFDGNGHIISGVLVSEYVNSSIQLVHSFGLFGYIGEYDGNRSTVRNMLLNLNVTGGNTVTNGKFDAENSNTGILAGISYGIIENCRTYGNVTGGETLSNYEADICNTGGVVGYNLWEVKDCINKGKVNGGHGNNGSRTGGIAGMSGSNNDQNACIKNCVNYGKITGGTHGNFSSPHVNHDSNITGTGGIIGNLAGGTIKNCTNYGEITTTAGDKGGVIGNYNRGTVYSCNKDYSSLNTIIGFNKTFDSKQIETCTGVH